MSDKEAASTIGSGIGTYFGGPLGGAIGGALLGGLFGGSDSVTLERAENVPKYTGPLGIATEAGFEYKNPVANQTALARAGLESKLPTLGQSGYTQGLNTALGGVGANSYGQQLLASLQGLSTGTAGQQLSTMTPSITYDPSQAQVYQQAYLDARKPAMEQALQQQANTQAAGISATGMAGSSGAMYQDALRQQIGNQQLNELQNQAVLGGQALAQQDLQNKINTAGALQSIGQQQYGNAANSAGLYSGLSQQEFANQLANANLYSGLQQNDIGNQLATSGFLQNMSQQDILNALNAQQGTAGQRLASLEGNINLTNQQNAATLGQTVQNNAASQSNLSNIFGGANAGMSLYNGIYGGNGSNPTSGGVKAVDTGTASRIPSSNGIYNAFPSYNPFITQPS